MQLMTKKIKAGEVLMDLESSVQRDFGPSIKDHLLNFGTLILATLRMGQP